ncbi:MAG: hybrid sensor histidine kinase/response regulator [Pseudomonadota bacterium]
MTGKKCQRSVLVIDDEPFEIDVLSGILSPEYLVRFALTGEKGLEIAQGPKPPDIILLDVVMPGLDGYEVCRRLKEHPTSRDIPVIFVTVKDEVQDETLGFNLGAVDYITKPIIDPIVRARVKTHVALKIARQELELQNQELREASRLREEVEQIARHDLKNPLQSIIGFSDLLLDSEGVSDAQVEHLSIIRDAGLRMLAMINTSLDIFKMERGLYKLNPAPVDLIAIIRRIGADLHSLAGRKRLALEICLNGRPSRPDDKFIVRSEELLCYTMLANLVKNALEASPEGETVTLTLKKESWHEITIQNKGTVPPPFRNIFFQKFSTHGKEGGAGLGTYSAMLIARTHGGGILLQGAEDEIVTVIIKLPLVPAASPGKDEQ